MDLKICYNCKIKKSLTEFYRDKGLKDGYKGECKQCGKRYPSKNKKLLLTPAEYNEYLKHCRKKVSAYYQKNKEHVRKVSLAWRNKNKDYVNARTREYFKNNAEAREKRKKISKEYHGRPEIKERQKALYYANREKIMAQHTIWCRNRRKTNMEYRLIDSLRGRLNSALRKRNVVKLETTMKLVGCSMPELIKYLENKFKPGMSWKNREKWHIDHIIPCISFDLSKLENQQKCFHYTNLQPLWAHENYSKGKKIISGDITSPKM